MKQINIQNFLNIVERHSLILKDLALNESVILTGQIFEEWTRYTISQSQELDSYKNFKHFFTSTECYLAKLPQNIAYDYNDMFDYNLVEQTIVMTFSFENPNIIDCIQKRLRKDFSLKKFISDYIIPILISTSID